MRLQTLVFVSTRNMYYVIFLYYDIAIVPTVYMYVIYILNKQSIFLSEGVILILFSKFNGIESFKCNFQG